MILVSCHSKFCLRPLLSISLSIILNSSLSVLYPVTSYTFFPYLPLSISLSLFVSSCLYYLYPVAFWSFLSTSTSIWLPVPIFYFLPMFLSPYHFRIFPCSLSCLYLVLLVPSASLSCSLSRLFISPSLFLRASSLLSALLPCYPSLSCLQHPFFWLPVAHLLSTSLCPSSCLCLPFSPSVLLHLGTERCSRLAAGISYVH